MKKWIWSIVALASGIILFLVIYLAIYNKSNAEISIGEKIADYKQDKAILLVIDIQEGTTGDYSINHAYQNKASSLFYSLDTVIQKAQKEQLPVVYIYNEITDPVINFFTNAMKKGSPGTELDSRLKVVSNTIFSKGKQDAFSNPEFENYLINNKINTLYITGVDAGYCVRSTVLAALNRNYQVRLIDEAIISKSDNLKKKSFVEMTAEGAEVINESRFLNSKFE